MSNYLDNLTEEERTQLANEGRILNPKKAKSSKPFLEETLFINIEHINLKKQSAIKLLNFISDIQDLQLTKYEQFNISINVTKRK